MEKKIHVLSSDLSKWKRNMHVLSSDLDKWKEKKTIHVLSNTWMFLSPFTLV
jgi:hypothetical protein